MLPSNLQRLSRVSHAAKKNSPIPKIVVPVRGTLLHGARNNISQSANFKHPGSTNRRRHPPSYDYQYEKLATAKELDQSTGWPGKTAKSTTTKHWSDKPTADSDGNYLHPQFHESLALFKTLKDDEGKLFDARFFRFLLSSPQLTEFTSDWKPGCADDIEAYLASLEGKVVEEWPEPNFGKAKDAEEAAKYYV
ncbi:uncharacterized protein RCC_06792 [Ramularia collo-cygni]|uniref:Uncharacterized protein n=1 Tax=Ramularia collo-cygni TaxID=112498 RepID=A0A2D3UW11_9PEZI|nr:uncharacterized protein RCC_06792 [Ramularia collo-cygni]CZT20931.1 uncharacterized protein RCC_06792 [Ramularia collo-cygni]